MSNTTNSAIVIAIDGPSGAGKGTLSQLVARQLGYHLLDSGALYRLTALSAIRKGVDLSNEADVARVAANLDVKFDVAGEGTRTLLEGDDVTRAIREESVGMNASLVAAYPMVRKALLQRQRDFAVAPGLVADGRDMGTTVFPQAKVKIFLTASAAARAERRYKQLAEKGVTVDMAELINDIEARDERDTNRSSSPLKPAEDAYILDSTSLSIEQVLEEILARAGSRLGA